MAEDREPFWYNLHPIIGEVRSKDAKDQQGSKPRSVTVRATGNSSVIIGNVRSSADKLDEIEAGSKVTYGQVRHEPKR